MKLTDIVSKKLLNEFEAQIRELTPEQNKEYHNRIETINNALEGDIEVTWLILSHITKTFSSLIEARLNDLDTDRTTTGDTSSSDCSR